MSKITVVCHKDHSHGYEDFEGKCLLCVVDDLMLEIGNLMVQKRRAEKQEQKTPLKVLGLTVFTENRLRNGRVYDVETLQAMTNRDILAIPDMGKKALKEVLEALAVYASDISQERVDETAKRKHEPVAWHEPGAYGNVTTHKDWALANGWEPLYKEKNT